MSDDENNDFLYRVDFDELGVEELPIAGEDRLSEVNEVFEGADHSALDEEVADVANLVRVVPVKEDEHIEEKTRCVDQRIYFCQLMELLALSTSFILEVGWPIGKI